MKIGLVLLTIVLGVHTYAAYCSEQKVNMHFVPHTHDDIGWLKTIDEYYYGANRSIEFAGVQFILDSVISALEKDPTRHFIYVEIAFFARWWREQDDSMRTVVRKLVSSGQLEFINGGWCMNDEAATHYNAIIDQMSLGLRFIRDEFGEQARPTVAWHIDPFGHSSEQASIHAMIGFNSFYFARIDYQDYEVREKSKDLQLVWQGSHTLGASSNIFTGVLYKTSYGAPPTFCFDVFCQDPPIQDDPDLFDYNVDERVNTFLNYTLTQAQFYHSDHIMLTMGFDFNYMNANNWFKNMDKLLKYINRDDRVNAFYSTPSKYTQALYDAKLKWPLKTDDFFPYANVPHGFWTGYFTSRPALKGYIRELNSLLQSCRHLEVFSQRKLAYYGPLAGAGSHVLAEAMGVAQHHDAITGTERQHVADDYACRLHIGQVACYNSMKAALNILINGPSTIVFDFEFCEYLNISSCRPIQSSNSFWFVVYNPSGRSRRIPLALPVMAGSGYTLKDVQGNNLQIDLFPVSPISKSLARKVGSGQYELNFIAEVPAMGYTRFEVSHSSSRARKISKSFINIPSSQGVEMKNDKMAVTFSEEGKLESVTDLTSGLSAGISQDFWWYNSSAGNTGKGKSHQASGAYIFRPNSSTPFQVSGKVGLVNFDGNMVKEVRQTFSKWVSQVVRIYEGMDYVELEYTVGPIPFEDGLGKEIISKFSTSLDTKGVWYTDANGRSMQKRVRNFRPTWKLNQTEPAAGNYYPVNSRIALVDETKGVQLVVLNDRSQGGASLSDGDMELMVHRRTLVDDNRGVGEPLNETGQFGDGLIIRGKHYLLLKPIKDVRHRSLGEEIMMSPVLAFSGSIEKDSKLTPQPMYSYSGLNKDLPPQIHLLTFTHDNATANTLLLRLEHMLEDSEGNSTITLSLNNLFRDFTITSAVELGLAGNVKLADINRLHFPTNNGVESTDFSQLYNPPTGEELNISIRPMQIRTFSLTYKWNQ